MDTEPLHWSIHIGPVLIPVADLMVRFGLSIRVIMRQRQYGVTLAWLVVILLLPFLGAIIYLFFGENRIGETRAKRANESLAHYQQWLASLPSIAPVDWSLLHPQIRPIHNQADNLIGIPTMDGNHLELIEAPEQIMRSIISDIDNSLSTCHLQFYIWHEGGTADEVVAAVIAAATRGVTCRILVDSIGSKEFLKGTKIKEMQRAGVRIEEELPAGFIKALFRRVDIRNHRKIVVIDGKIAYTGSQNMVDPNFFKKDAGVGQWIDIMVRVQGPVVEALAGTFISDWFLETDNQKVRSRSLAKDILHVREIADINHQPKVGKIPIQFVPFTALQAAAQRGVDVRIIVPEKNDSLLVHYASWARYENMIKSGVSIKLFTGGLLHSKTITVDDEFSLFGSVNLDMRSFWLNFEATLFIYNQDFTKELRGIQSCYEEQSKNLELSYFKDRPLMQRFFENSALIIGPLL